MKQLRACKEGEPEDALPGDNETDPLKGILTATYSGERAVEGCSGGGGEGRGDLRLSRNGRQGMLDGFFWVFNDYERRIKLERLML